MTFIHGMRHTRFYRLWQAMVTRCTNKKAGNYIYYGGRGITVCNKWIGPRGFLNFRDDMYKSYLNHVEEFGEKNTTLDRKKVSGNYELENVKWETLRNQFLNRRISSKTKNLKKHSLWRLKLKKSLSALIRGDQRTFPKYIKYFGCIEKELLLHISFQFKEGMSWNNYGPYTRKNPNVWNIDHIKPCYMFDLSIEKDRYLCYNYKNLRPIWALENVNRNRFENLGDNR